MAQAPTRKSQIWSGLVLLMVVATLITIYVLWVSSTIEEEYDPPVVNDQTHRATDNSPVLYKTYTSEAHGFRVQYPTNWFAEETSSGEGSDEIFSVQLRDDKQGVTISDMPVSLEGVVRDSIAVTDEMTTEVDGQSATRLTGTDAKDGSSYTVMLIEHGDRLYTLSGSGQTFDDVVHYFELL